MKSERNNKKLQVYVSERLLEDLDKIATMRDMTQSSALRMLLELGVDIHKDFARVGIIRLVDMVHSTRQLLRDINDPDKLSIEVVVDGKVVEKNGVKT